MPKDILKHLGNRVRTARKDANLTQEKLSQQADVSVRHIAKIEKGEMNPSFEILYRLVNCLGISADTLFHPDLPSEEAEIKQLAGYYHSCDNPKDRELILETVQCMSRKLSQKSSTQGAGPF